MAQSDEEVLARGLKRIELKDPNAMSTIAMAYGHGRLGLPVDQAKCIDLLRQSDDLGCTMAQCTLSLFLHTGAMGLEQNKDEAFQYAEKAAEGGNLNALHNVGSKENRNGNSGAAIRHWRLAAAGGFMKSMLNLIVCFDEGFLRHGDLAESVQAFYLARAEMKSEDRDQYIKHLKETGEYKEEYEKY